MIFVDVFFNYFKINIDFKTSLIQASVLKKIIFKFIPKDTNTIFIIDSKKNGGNLIQISTDYVFNGLNSSAYKENDNVSPIIQYGFSKAKAEEFIQEIEAVSDNIKKDDIQ